MLGLRTFVKTTLLLSTLVAAAVVPQAVFVTDAMAASKTKRKVAVGVFEGNKNAEIRGAFIDALKADGTYDVTDAEDVKAGKAKALAETAKGLDVHVIITGKVSRGFGLKLKVYNGADGKLLDEADIKGGALAKLKANIEKNGVSSVAAGIEEATVEEKEEEPPPPEEPPAEEPTEEAPAEEQPAANAADDVPSSLDVTAGLRPMHRTFEFKNTLADLRPNQGYRKLVSYELPLGPVLFIDLNWFPASHVTQGPAAWLGLTAGFEKGIATKSVFAEGVQGAEQTLETNEMQWYAGARFRLPIGAQQLGLTATYGQHTFALNGNENNALTPDVKYGYARVGVDGLFRFGEFLAGARVGKRFVFSTGSLETLWFPNTKTSSLEAGVTVGYRLTRGVDLVTGFDWLRYSFDFNPVAQPPADRASLVAGGAVDEYMTGHIAFRFQLPGKASTP